MRDKKKIVAFLIAVALGGGALIVCSAQSSATEPQKTSYNPYSLSANDPNHSGGPFDMGELFLKMMAAIVLAVVLGIAAIYLSKKFLPKITNLPGKEIRIAETVHLGPHKAVHLLEIGNRRLLIGSTNENITRLADLTSAFTELSVQEIDNN